MFFFFSSIETESELQNVFTLLMFMSGMKPWAPATVVNRSEARHAQVVSFSLKHIAFVCVSEDRLSGK